MITDPSHTTTSVDQRPTEAVAGDSPLDAAIPFWVTACVRLQPPKRRNGAEITASLANAVFPAVQALIADRLRTEGEAEAPLNRDRIARRCGLGDATKAGWLFDYLESIGFLRIQRHYAGVGRGRRADTFTIFTRPSANYVGPHTHAELERALDDPDRRAASVLFIDKTAGHAIDAGSGAYRNDQDAQSGRLVDKTAGHAIDAGSGAYRNDQDAQSGRLVDKTAGHAIDAGSGAFLLIDRSSISEREIEGSIEPVPGGAAKPPATGQDKRLAAEVRRLVRRFPWGPWAERQNVGYALNERDLRLVTEPICAAIAAGRLTVEQAEKIGPAALDGVTKAAKPAGYVAEAFARHLDDWLERITVVAPEGDVLPLPSLAHQQVSGPKLAKPRRGGTGAAGEPNSDAPAKPPLPACVVCDAREDEEYPNARTVTGDDGREHPCPKCAELGLCPPPDQPF